MSQSLLIYDLEIQKQEAVHLFQGIIAAAKQQQNEIVETQTIKAFLQFEQKLFQQPNTEIFITYVIEPLIRALRVLDEDIQSKLKALQNALEGQEQSLNEQIEERRYRLQKVTDKEKEWMTTLHYQIRDIEDRAKDKLTQQFLETYHLLEDYLQDKQALKNPDTIIEGLETTMLTQIDLVHQDINQQAKDLQSNIKKDIELELSVPDESILDSDRPDIMFESVDVTLEKTLKKGWQATFEGIYKFSQSSIVGGIIGGAIGTLLGGIGSTAGAILGAKVGGLIGGATGAWQTWSTLNKQDLEEDRRQLHKAMLHYIKSYENLGKHEIKKVLKHIERSLGNQLTQHIQARKNDHSQTLLNLNRSQQGIYKQSWQPLSYLVASRQTISQLRSQVEGFQAQLQYLTSE